MNSTTARVQGIWRLLGAALICIPCTVSAATLTNRYSFTADATDSVSGKNGVLVNGGSVIDGSLYLDGSSEQYVDLPNDLIAGLTSITIEAWITPSFNSNWTRIWDFGNSNAGEGRADYGTKHFMCYILPNLQATIYAGGTDSWVISSPAYTLPVDEQVHVVWTSDGVTRRARLYVNGVLRGKNDSASNTPAKLGATFNNWLGRSQFSADPYFTGAFNEFRIWDGALTAFEVMASGSAGPDRVDVDPGALTSLEMTVNFQMIKGNSQQATVMATTSKVPAPVNIADMPGIAYRPGDANILTVTDAGVIRALAAGTTTLTVSYGGRSDSATITVVEQPAQMTHRYSFTANANDAIGTAHGTLFGGAAIADGQVVLDPVTESFVELPAGIIANYEALTVETWASFGSIGTWSRLWSFGEQNDAGQGRYYVELCPHGGSTDTYISISDSDPGGSHADPVAYAAALDDQTDVHLAAVFNPLAGYHALYVNGRLAGVNTTPTVALAGVKDSLNWIGRSLYSADPYLEGSVDELRIYRGALSSLEIGVSHASGPETPKQTAGALQSITLQLPSTMTAESGAAPTVLATYASLTNYSLAANTIGPVPGLSYTTSDPAVLFVGPDGLIHSGGPGRATVTASFQGKTSTAEVTVTQPAPATLRHRYSFESGANDSAGTAHGTLRGGARVSGGKLVLNGSIDTYLELPGGLVSGLKALTVEFWADLGVQPNWPRVFDFGAIEGNNGANFIFFTPKTHFGAHRFGIATTAGASDLDTPSVLENVSLHVVCVYDPATGFQGVYTNGVLEAANYNARVPLDTVAADYSFVGRSLFSADGFLNASLDELRIYEGRLTSDQVRANALSGPQDLARPALSVSVTGGSVVLRWPVDATGFVLESSPTLGPAAAWTVVSGSPVSSGGFYTFTAPVANTTFYRLRK